jgi:hypothetical protein
MWSACSKALCAFAFLAVGLGFSAQAPAQLEMPNIKVMLDWTIQSTHSPFFVAEKKGYFKQEGFQSVQIDRGTGAGNTVTSIASGVYNIGYSDLAVMVKFNAQNPGKGLMATYVTFDEPPIAFVSLKSRPIRTPAELEGKRLATPANSANVIESPSAGIAVMKERDPLFNAPLESTRLGIAMTLMYTERVQKNGLSAVLPERLAKTIDTVVTSESLPYRPKPEEVWTDRFLPPLADRQAPKLGK